MRNLVVLSETLKSSDSHNHPEGVAAAFQPLHRLGPVAPSELNVW